MSGVFYTVRCYGFGKLFLKLGEGHCLVLIWKFGTEYIIRSLTIGMQYQGIKISGVAP